MATIHRILHRGSNSMISCEINHNGGDPLFSILFETINPHVQLAVYIVDLNQLNSLVEILNKNATGSICLNSGVNGGESVTMVLDENGIIMETICYGSYSVMMNLGNLESDARKTLAKNIESVCKEILSMSDSNPFEEKNVVLLRLTDADGDVVALLVKKDVADTFDQDRFDGDGINFEYIVLDRNLTEYIIYYENKKNNNKLVKMINKAQQRGYTVVEEMNFVNNWTFGI